ncbi:MULTISPECIES: methyl-accepting chemotaxis protein [Methylomonas]|uniref:Chemotaxis protein n=1 Tax=Methylomonas koyamae TaxID=702114 RepID=A0A177PBZ1_9GAMM|nr:MULTISPECIES: methyl-accepting chemotaxis protein [Methylomonas]OAI27867.1 chemotaxis protein [Methylomonas koyamae]OHX37956.1 methyl-accepting chemotaxis protein [Methylomonas sp. LWB]WGS87080.1 methyl-accepting chemotaxis protein [Methylomonas sp. UP202]
MNSQTTIQSKILLSIASVFVVLMLVSNVFMAGRQKDMVQALATDKAKNIAAGYFDGINTLMLTGSMSQVEVLREKALSHPGVSEVRLIRGNGIVELHGKGKPEQAVVDELDRRGLSGEALIRHGNDANGRWVTVVEPILASSNFRGTNCLTCHPVKEGEVLGAVRVSYSLASLDDQINQDLIAGSAISLAMFAAGLLLVNILMRRIVVNPLVTMRDTVDAIARHSDLTARLPVDSGDEIGQVSTSFNSMLANFAASLNRVSDVSRLLTDATDRIATVSRQTSQAASQQQRETENVIQAIHELEESVRDVRHGADGAARASVEADQQAAQGAETTKNAIDGIYVLVSEIERASEVIKRLDQKSNGVGAVLDVIKGLAEQTNLLALNAAIEAARAGEQGRGFAVVADEVRTLATRSHQATEEIEKIIDQLQREAKEAVTVMDKAKTSAEQRREQVQSADLGLSAIAERVTQIRSLNSQMALVADNQSRVAQHVGQSIGNIGGLTDRTSQDAAQTSDASRELVQLAVQLNELVGKFRR